jgi:hypothetical protein
MEKMEERGIKDYIGNFFDPIIITIGIKRRDGLGNERGQDAVNIIWLKCRSGSSQMVNSISEAIYETVTAKKIFNG